MKERDGAGAGWTGKALLEKETKREMCEQRWLVCVSVTHSDEFV